MRWVPALILAYVCVGLQAGLSVEMRIRGIGPNLPLLAAVFIALSAPREPALLCCLIIGGLQDLATQQPPGLYALSYGLAGLIVTGVTQVVYRGHPLTHAMLALISGVLTACVLWVHGLLVPLATATTTADGAHLPATRIGIGSLLGTALYTALLAPIVLFILLRLRPLFGFAAARRGHRGGIGMVRSPF